MLITGLLALSLANAVDPGASSCAGETHGPAVGRVVAMSLRPSEARGLASGAGVPVHLIVAENGEALHVSAEGDLPEDVRRAAEQAVAQWNFSAARECGVTVARSTTVVVPLVISRAVGSPSQVRPPGPTQGADFGRTRPPSAQEPPSSL
jgi:hypothetical protein